MGQYAMKLPDVGEGIVEAEITAWHVAVGDMIREDQPLVDVMTDKATVEIPSPVSGKVMRINGAPGDTLPIGTVLVVIETGDAAGAPGDEPEVPAAAEPAAPAPPASAVQAAPPAPSNPVRSPGDKPIASPAVRRRAWEHGVDLWLVAATGPGGRITQEDLDRHLDAHGPSPIPETPAPAAREGVEEIAVVGLRRTIATRLQSVAQRIPHFSYVEEIDVTELEALRRHLNETRSEGRARLTLLPFLIRALVLAVGRFPQVNAHFDDEAGVIRRHQAVHAGIATQTPQGLVVPVLRHAEARGLWDCAAEIARLAAAARAGRASRDELTGSTLTITSLGAMGGVATTPVINHPEVAIVGVNKMVERPVVRGGAVTVRKMMNLSSSFDHRVVDGWDGAAFIQDVKGLLEHPATLFIE